MSTQNSQPGSTSATRSNLTLTGQEGMPRTYGRTGITQGQLTVDRRTSIRLPMTGVAMAAFDDGEGGTILTSVELTDTSAAGLGIRCPVKVTPGTRFSLYSDGATWTPRTGTVSRCAEDGHYYRCGLAIRLLAAA
ncbi:MAG: PilZ domain-containing protein [Planctomycetes bacterium]|nr:PilZ domain-containing protein [Planctomycetota bacterium]